LLKSAQAGLYFILALLAAASLWFYVDRILVTYQVADATAHDRPRGNLSDLYPRWLGTRELLLHGKDPYSAEVTREIQQGYYGRALDASRPDDPKDQQGFAYPVYVVFLLAPFIGLPFHTVQVFFHWLLVGLTAVSVTLWLRVLNWRLTPLSIAASTVLVLGSLPAVQGIKLQQLSLLVAGALATSAACIAGGWFFSGGAILAVATIKPQLVWLMAAWLLLWSLSDWRSRRRVVFGFVATMAAFLAGAQVLLPGWWRMFLEAVRQYRQYTHNESVLDQLVNWSAGRFAGSFLAAAAVLLGGAFLWRARKEPAGSPEFGRVVAFLTSLTVLIVPMYAPYNQVLFLPAILSLWRDRASLIRASRLMRVVYALSVLALCWPWIATIGLTVTWAFSHGAALRAWAAPFYPTLALPVVVFALLFFSAQRTQHALRWRKPAE
jgi:hypothetical protein